MPIATGNWGCGVFGGDIFLKALLQSLAATVADRPRLDYYTVGDAGLTDQIRGMFEQVRKRHFLRHLYIKTNILPRQARDKHRKNSKKVPFSCRSQRKL